MSGGGRPRVVLPYVFSPHHQTSVFSPLSKASCLGLAKDGIIPRKFFIAKALTLFIGDIL
jgi:hypothetical protein